MENLHEEGRGFRHRKKQTDPICCPVCGVTIRGSEIEQHYALEVDRLLKLQLNQKIKKSLNNGNTYHDPLPGCSSNGDDSSGCPWVTFQKIRNNRHSRLRIKTRKRKADEPICPICNERPNEDINVHVEMCLRKSENSNCNKTNNGAGSGCGINIRGDGGATSPSDDDESIDIEGESFDEYEWAGQKRIRAASLLQGGYTAAGIGISISNCNNDDDDEDLNVDGDDTQIYGPPQYTERDVVLPLSGGADCEKEENENVYLRKLVTGHDTSVLSQHSIEMNNCNSTAMDSSDQINENEINRCDRVIGNNNNNNENIDNNSEKNPTSITGNHNNNSNHSIICTTENNNDRISTVGGCGSSTDNNYINNNNNNTANSQIIESLKVKIREYENQISNKIKCLICMDEFRNPAVSICCWHVHCEECWLRTLGARKLCPQCNMITSPSDLRRIYM